MTSPTSGAIHSLIQPVLVQCVHNPWPEVMEHTDEVPSMPSATRGLGTARKMENNGGAREVGLVC